MFGSLSQRQWYRCWSCSLSPRLPSDAVARALGRPMLGGGRTKLRAAFAPSFPFYSDCTSDDDDLSRVKHAILHEHTHRVRSAHDNALF
jgi:hypothetical protein